MRTLKYYFSLLSLTCLLLYALISSAQADYYTYVSLGTLGGKFGTARGVNDSGQVVGRADTVTAVYPASSLPHAFLWQNGVMTDLGTLGGPTSEALDINNFGQIVGVSDTATGQKHAFLWQNGVMTDLGTLGGANSTARAINDAGQIVGQSDLANAHQHGFLYANGVMTNLGIPADGINDYSDAVDINSAGEIVGTYNIQLLINNDSGFCPCWRTYDNAFIFSGGVLTGLPATPSAKPSGPALALNNNGQVLTTVPIFDPGNNYIEYYQDYIYSRGTNTYISLPFYSDFNKTDDMNSAGQVVGTRPASLSPVASDALLYDSATATTTALALAVAPSPEYDFSYLRTFVPYAISDQKYIAGVGSGYQSVGLPFILIPVTTQPSDIYIASASSSYPIVSQGGTITYTVTVRAKNDQSSNVTLTDVLPVDTTLVSAEYRNDSIVIGRVSSGSCDGTTTITCNVGTVSDYSEFATVTIKVIANQIGVISNPIRVSGSGFDPYLFDNTTTLYTTVIPTESADMSVSIDGPTQVISTAGNITYQLHVANNGPDAVSSVRLRDDHAGTSFLSASPSVGICSHSTAVLICDMGALASGATATVTLVVAPGYVGSNLNYLSVQSSALDPNSANNSASLTTIVADLSDLSVLLTASPSSVVVGETVNYTIKVTNSGPAAAQNVSVKGTLPTCLISYLSSGGSASCIATVTASTLGTLTQAMTASHTLNYLVDPNLANNSASVSTSVLDATTDLSLSMSAPAAVLQGQTVTYVVMVTNNGPTSATGLTLSGLSGCTLASSTLASGASTNCTMSITPTTVGTLTQSVSVAGNETDPNIANNTASVSTTVNPAADLALSITDSPDPVEKGAKLTYTLTVKNNGPSTATNVSLTDTLPANIIFVSTTKTQGSCNGTTTVTCALGTLNSGATATVKITVKPKTTGTLTNSASVSAATSDPNTANNSASTSTVVKR